MRPMLADLDTFSAENADAWTERDLTSALLRFGIVAPNAAQWTAFQEDRRSNAGAIVQGGALEIEDRSRCHVSGIRCEVSSIRLNLTPDT